jgi:hypothetical protein
MKPFQRPAGRPATPIFLDGSAKDMAPLRMCDYHGEPAQQGGGVQRTPTRWACSVCWKAKHLGTLNKGRSKS